MSDDSWTGVKQDFITFFWFLTLFFFSFFFCLVFTPCMWMTVAAVDGYASGGSSTGKNGGGGGRGTWRFQLYMIPNGIHCFTSCW